VNEFMTFVVLKVLFSADQVKKFAQFPVSHSKLISLKLRYPFNSNDFVKTFISRWNRKKLHMQGALIFYYFGVLEYVVIIEN
jgi:hypothetical protein